MKKVLLLFLSAIFLSLHSFSQQNGYLIKGKINGGHDTLCFLGNYYGKFNEVKDTTRIDKNGDFIFKGNKILPEGIYLIIFPNQSWMELVMDKDQNISFETDTMALIKNMQIKASEENILYYKYLNFVFSKQTTAEVFKKRIDKIKKDSIAATTFKKDSLKSLQQNIDTLAAEVEKYKNNFIAKHPTTLMATIFIAQKDPIIPETPTLPDGKKDSLFPYRYYLAHFWDNIPPSDDRLLRTPIFHVKLEQFFNEVVVQSPDSIIKEADLLIAKTKGNKETFKYIVWYLTHSYEDNKIMGMDAVFVHLADKYYATKRAYWADSITLQKIIHRANVLKPLLIGQPAPPITLQDSSGKNISLYDIKSKYTLLIFWDPDCGHCQHELPTLKKIYDTSLKSRGLTIVSIDMEDNVNKWKKFITDNKLNWINTRDQYKKYSFHDLYDIYSTPVTYLLDANKIIQAKRIDADRLEAYINFLEKRK